MAAPRKRTTKIVTTSKTSKKPSPSKIVTLVVSVGADDTSSMEDFQAHLKQIIGGMVGKKPLATVVNVEYQYDGKRYSRKNWEEWDGDPTTLPDDLYTAKPPPVKPINSQSPEPLTSAKVRTGVHEFVKDYYGDDELYDPEFDDYLPDDDEIKREEEDFTEEEWDDLDDDFSLEKIDKAAEIEATKITRKTFSKTRRSR